MIHDGEDSMLQFQESEIRFYEKRNNKRSPRNRVGFMCFYRNNSKSFNSSNFSFKRWVTGNMKYPTFKTSTSSCYVNVYFALSFFLYTTRHPTSRSVYPHQIRIIYNLVALLKLITKNQNGSQPWKLSKATLQFGFNSFDSHFGT